MSTYETLCTGGVIEKELLGVNRQVVEFESDQEYETYSDALRNVRESQLNSNLPYNPIEPNEHSFPFAWNLHAEIGELLGFKDEDWDSGKLKFFTAVGSIFDKKHGVDGFVELEIEPGKSIVVTFDITANPHKQVHKADIIIKVLSDGLDPDIDKDDFYDIISQASTEIFKVFNYKLDQKKYFFTNKGKTKD